MLYLADCAHEDGSNIYPSVATIAKNTRLSERQVQRQIKTLLASGELVDVGRSPLGTRQFLIPTLPEMSPRHIVTPDIHDSKGVTNRAENDVQNVTRSVIRNPLEENHTSFDMVLLSFTVFYDAYPRREAKAAALKAWRALKPDDELQDRIILDVERFVGRERQFIPLPSTYLRGRRWEDERPVAAVARAVPIRARVDDGPAEPPPTPEQAVANKAILHGIIERLATR